MTDYNEILDTQIDQDSAITEDLMTQMRDNPIAIAEGADGAPRVQGVALGGRLVGIVDGASNTWDAFAGLDGIGVITIRGMSRSIGTAGNIQVAFSDDNGSSWGSSQTIATVSGNTGNDFTTFCATINCENGASIVDGVKTGTSAEYLDGYKSFSIPSGVNAIRVRSTAGEGLKCAILIEEGVA